MSSNIRVNRICQHCGNEFIAKTTVTKYCGDTCAKRAYKARMRKKNIEQSDKVTKEIIKTPIVSLQAREYLSTSEVTQILGISRTTIWRLTKDGKLNATKLGGRSIYRRKDIDQLFD